MKMTLCPSSRTEDTPLDGVHKKRWAITHNICLLNIQVINTIMMKNKHFWLCVSAFVAIKLLMHLASFDNYELHRDEYLYAAMGKHLDWGYFSVPPLIGLFSKIASSLFGQTIFAYKLIPALLSAGIIVTTLLFVKELGGKLFAVLLAGCATLFSISMMRVGGLFQPVCFDVFFWTLSAYFVLKLIKNNEPRYWLHIGISIGIAFLNKYMIVFFAAGLIIAMASTSHRILIQSKYFILGAIAGLVIISPNIWWQYQHHWVVLHHLEELKKTQLVNVSISDFLIDQIMMNINSVLVLLIGLWALCLNKERPYRVFLALYLATMILFVLTNAKSYYSLGLYPFLTAIGSYAVEKYIHQSKRALSIPILALTVLISLPVVPIGLTLLPPEEMSKFMERVGSKTGIDRWEDGKHHKMPQDYADMLGWCEMAQYVVRTYQGLPSKEKQQCAIYAENYGQAGAIDYYGSKSGIPTPISFSDAFLYWAPSEADFKTLIYVNDDTSGIKKMFANVRLMGKINNRLAREQGTGVFLCKDPLPEFYPFYKEKVKKMKESF